MESLCKFASKLYCNLKSNKNTFFSPASIQTCLGMVCLGAKNKTFDALKNLLELTDDYKATFKKFISETQNSEFYELKLTNALWIKKGFILLNEYLSSSKEIFSANSNELDFNDKSKCAEIINFWCNENTNGKISNIITKENINSDTRLILTNAIYFKGSWEKSFDEDHTMNVDFATPNGSKQVKMMNQTSKFDYYENDDLQAVDLNYKGNLSMLVILPKKEIDNLATIYIDSISNLKKRKVILSLPKFKIETQYQLTKNLIDLGGYLPFSDNADFSGISSENLKIDSVIHKAFVEVNETGTEAAAVTAVMMMRCTSFSLEEIPIVFNANKPFVFFIRNKTTNDILFCGEIKDPSF